MTLNIFGIKHLSRFGLRWNGYLEIHLSYYLRWSLQLLSSTWPKPPPHQFYSCVLQICWLSISSKVWLLWGQDSASSILLPLFSVLLALPSNLHSHSGWMGQRDQDLLVIEPGTISSCWFHLLAITQTLPKYQVQTLLGEIWTSCIWDQQYRSMEWPECKEWQCTGK